MLDKLYFSMGILRKLEHTFLNVMFSTSSDNHNQQGKETGRDLGPSLRFEELLCVYASRLYLVVE